MKAKPVIMLLKKNSNCLSKYNNLLVYLKRSIYYLYQRERKQKNIFFKNSYTPYIIFTLGPLKLSKKS